MQQQHMAKTQKTAPEKKAPKTAPSKAPKNPFIAQHPSTAAKKAKGGLHRT